MTARKLLTYLALIVVSVITWELSLNNRGTVYTFGDWSINISLTISFLTCVIMIFEGIRNVVIWSDSQTTRQKLSRLMHLPLVAVAPVVYLIIFYGLLRLDSLKDELLRRPEAYADFKVGYSLAYLWVNYAMTLFYTYALQKSGRETFKEEINLFRDICNKIDLPMASAFTLFALIYAYFLFFPNDSTSFPDGNLNRISYFAIGGSGLHIATSLFLFVALYVDEFINDLLSIFGKGETENEKG